MNRRRWCVGIGAWAAVPLLAACAGLPLGEPVQVHVVGLEPLPGEGLELRMAVKLRVQNPNDAALDFDGIALTLDLGGMSFATGVSDRRGSVPRFGETVVTVPVSVAALAAVRQIVALAARERRKVDYALRGRISGTGWGAARFESAGEIDLDGLALRER